MVRVWSKIFVINVGEAWLIHQTVSANLKRVHIEPKHIHIGHDLSHIAPKMG